MKKARSNEVIEIVLLEIDKEKKEAKFSIRVRGCENWHFITGVELGIRDTFVFSDSTYPNKLEEWVIPPTGNFPRQIEDVPRKIWAW